MWFDRNFLMGTYCLFLRFILKYFFSGVSRKKINEMRQTSKKKCIVCLAADYGNLGDVAITYAQTQYLNDHFPDYEVVDFPISKTLKYLKTLRKVCTPNDVITIVGGGNMGDLYYDIELLRLLIVWLFPKNRVIIFPQTIDYSSSTRAKHLLLLSKYIYKSHKQLTICAREEVSYESMIRYYKECNIKLVPDIVMSLCYKTSTNSRNGVLFCLRDDKEKADNDLYINSLKYYVETLNKRISYYDTHIDKFNMDVPERIVELEKIWKRMASSELVVTDRLHGMIFAYLTQTPAIVLPNNNYKIEKCYKWIEGCGYIQFVKNQEVFNKCVLDQLKVDESSFEKTRSSILKKLDNILN